MTGNDCPQRVSSDADEQAYFLGLASNVFNA